jgi:PIN domain nuclease of toxin-antitoxin system
VKALLDTHVWWWWTTGERKLSAAQERLLRAVTADDPVLVSDISLWEIATLASLGRIALAIPLREWLESAAAPPLVQRCGISPAVAAELATLPETFHRDPADRILVATARVHGATLVTRDRRIIDARLVKTLA